MNIQDLTKALQISWSAETSSDSNWSIDNPALGQCAVSALILHDFLGGDILNVRVTTGKYDVSHYVNMIDDQLIDLTRSQFGSDATFSKPQPKLGQYSSTREYCLSFPDTKNRYELLKSRVAKYVH